MPKKKLQNSDLIEQLNKEFKEVVKFNLRIVTESGTNINIRQHQLNDICYDIIIVPKNRNLNFIDVPLYDYKDKVNVYSLKDGELKATFESITEAQSFSSERGYTYQNILNCCNKKKSHLNYHVFIKTEDYNKDFLDGDFYINRFGISKNEVIGAIKEGKKLL